MSYNDTPLGWNQPVSTWVTTLGPPSAERVVPAVEGEPDSVEETETTWSHLGMRVISSNGLPERVSIRTSGAVINSEPRIDLLMLPGEDGQPTIGVFPGSLTIEGAQIVEGDTVSRIAGAFRARCHPEFTRSQRALMGWTHGGSCRALDYDTVYYFFNGFHSQTERIDYVVGVRIVHYAHDELETERRNAGWSELPTDR